MTRISPVRECYACLKEKKICDICFKENNDKIINKMLKLKILRNVSQVNSSIEFLNPISKMKEYYTIKYNKEGIPFEILKTSIKPRNTLKEKYKNFLVKRKYKKSLKDAVKNSYLKDENLIKRITFLSLNDEKNLKILEDRDLTQKQSINSVFNCEITLIFINLLPIIFCKF